MYVHVVSVVMLVYACIVYTTYIHATLNFLLIIIFLKVLQQVTALQEINCVSVAAGQDHTVVVADE